MLLYGIGRLVMQSLGCVLTHTKRDNNCIKLKLPKSKCNQRDRLKFPKTLIILVLYLSGLNMIEGILTKNNG